MRFSSIYCSVEAELPEGAIFEYQYGEGLKIILVCAQRRSDFEQKAIGRGFCRSSIRL